MRLAMEVNGGKPRVHVQPRFVDVDAKQMFGQTLGVQQLAGRAD